MRRRRLPVDGATRPATDAVTIEVFAADEQVDRPVDTIRWVKLAEAVLAEEGVRGDAELSMLFVDEPAMADLNKRFLRREGPTDVLAFPIDEEPVEGGRSPDSGGTGPGFTGEPDDLPTLLGDVVICPAVAFRNASKREGNYDDEVALLVVHGVLHLLGMDHDDETDAEVMQQREQQLLAKFYVRDPVPESAVSPLGVSDEQGQPGPSTEAPS